tara:strand:- start:359 stop:922 length:564 start_codon:yes stop_codon:yes gene_type:complete
MRMDDSEYNQLELESFLEDEERSRNDRLDRFIELNKLFGPQGDMLLQGGYQSLFALHEAGNSYVNGNYMAVILLSQAFIEHSLSGQFILAGEYAIAESGFKRIIDKALTFEFIDNELYAELDELRKLRNPYVHAKVGLKAGSLMKRFIKEQHFDAEQMAKLDAVRSLEILKKFKDASVSMWFYEDEA